MRSDIKIYLRTAVCVILALSVFLISQISVRAAGNLKLRDDRSVAPAGITSLGNEALLVADQRNNVIWIVTSEGSAYYAGTPGVLTSTGESAGGYKDGAQSMALFGKPWDISPFLDGFAVSDPDNKVVRIIHQGKVQTLNPVIAGDTVLDFIRPTGLATDGAGNLYVADSAKGAIQVIKPDGNAYTLISGLNTPTGLCWLGDQLYVAETGANRIIVLKEGRIVAYAGSGQEGKRDGAAASAEFSSPMDVAVAADGTVYVADTANGSVRRIRQAVVDTILSEDLNMLSKGPASPSGILLMGGALYVTDTFACKMYTLYPGGMK